MEQTPEYHTGKNEREKIRAERLSNEDKLRERYPQGNQHLLEDSDDDQDSTDSEPPILR